MFEQELFMFEHMPQLELCNKAIFDKLDYLVGERDVKTWKILKDVFFIIFQFSARIVFLESWFFKINVFSWNFRSCKKQWKFSNQNYPSQLDYLLAKNLVRLLFNIFY